MAKYTDITSSFSRNFFTNDVSKASDLEAIKQSIVNLCVYGFGDKPFNPQFGSGVYELLFENLDREDYVFMSNKIQRHLERYEPRAFFEKVVFSPVSDANLLTLEVHYIVNIEEDEPAKQSIKLSLGRTR